METLFNWDLLLILWYDYIVLTTPTTRPLTAMLAAETTIGLICEFSGTSRTVSPSKKKL